MVSKNENPIKKQVLGTTRSRPKKPTYPVMPIFLFLFLGKENTKGFGYNPSPFSKLTQCTALYTENQNMLQIRMLHFLVILMLMQFYVMQL